MLTLNTPLYALSLSHTLALFISLFLSLRRQYFSTAREESNSHWQKTMICTIILFPVIVVLITSALNCVAVSYGTISAIPITVILKVHYRYPLPHSILYCPTVHL
jgi:Endomembrane protein 70